MRVPRVITKQGHPVPSSSYSARGPFPPELFMATEIISEYTSIDSEVPIGGTAQNNFTAPKLFKCSVCSMLVLEQEIPDHVCPEAEEDSGQDT